MTAEISPPSLSSSLDSLQSALIKSDRAAKCLLLSPTPVATGDTGSTEEPYSASRSLAESVDRRSGSSRDQEEDYTSAHESEEDQYPLRTPPPSSKRGLSPQIGSHAPRRAGMTTPSRSLVSDESWSQVASPLLRGREQSPFIAEEEEHDRIFIKEEECSEDGKEALRRSTTEEEEEEGDYPLDDYCLPITTSQARAADYALRTRRSQSDFSRWLEDAMAHARGDGTSTVGPSPSRSKSVSLTFVRHHTGLLRRRPLLHCRCHPSSAHGTRTRRGHYLPHRHGRALQRFRGRV